MVYEDEEPDARDPNYDESAQVRLHVLKIHRRHKLASIVLKVLASPLTSGHFWRGWVVGVGYCVVQAAFFVPERPRPTKLRLSGRLLLCVVEALPLKFAAPD